MNDSVIQTSTLLDILLKLIPTEKVRIRNIDGEIRILPISEPKNNKRLLGFVDGNLPESFFDPLPEEELKLWGL